MILQNNEIALKTEGVNKFFQQPEKFQVLFNISMTVWKGEFVTIMGKSGCGKSTLLSVGLHYWYLPGLVKNNNCFPGLRGKPASRCKVSFRCMKAGRRHK